MYGGSEKNNAPRGQAMGWLVVACIGCIGVLIIASLRLHSWAKVLPLVGILFLLIVAGMAYFTYWFSGYGQL